MHKKGVMLTISEDSLYCPAGIEPSTSKEFENSMPVLKQIDTDTRNKFCTWKIFLNIKRIIIKILFVHS